MFAAFRFLAVLAATFALLATMWVSAASASEPTVVTFEPLVVTAAAPALVSSDVADAIRTPRLVEAPPAPHAVGSLEQAVGWRNPAVRCERRAMVQGRIGESVLACDAEPSAAPAQRMAAR